MAGGYCWNWPPRPDDPCDPNPPGGGGGGGGGGGSDVPPGGGGPPPGGDPRRNPPGESEDPGEDDGPGGTPPHIYSFLIPESLRENADENFLVPWNHRFRGHREAFKFNLLIYSAIGAFNGMTTTLKTWDGTLSTREANMYPSTTEIREFNYIRGQIRHKEYLLLRDSNKRWFV